MNDADGQVRKIIEVRKERTAPPCPRRLTLQITNLCNSRCKMCHIWRIYPDGNEDVGRELSTAEWLVLIERAVESGVSHIDVTGGEPFMKPGIVDLCAGIMRLLGFTSIVTNAVTPGATAIKIGRILKAAPSDATLSVTVSIDGLPGTNAELRGIADGYDRACRLLRSLRAMKEGGAGLLTNVSFTIQQENHSELIPLLEALLDADLIDSPENFFFRPVASLHYYRTSNEGAAADVVRREIELAQEHFDFASRIPFLEGVKVNLADPARMVLPCYALFASCWVDPYGNVSPCVTMTDNHIGNVRNHNLDIIGVWHSSQADEIRSMIADDSCPVCWTDCQANENLFYDRVSRG